jgi:hypothetical protein
VTFLAIAALLLTVVSLMTMTGIIFAPFLFGLFLLALAGVLALNTDGRVRQHNRQLDPDAWRSRA